MKIDVERAEIEVLQGMEQTLREHRPHVVVEARDDHANWISGFVRRLDYSFKPITESMDARQFGYYYLHPR